jgi:signal peptidase I
MAESKEPQFKPQSESAAERSKTPKKRDARTRGSKTRELAKSVGVAVLLALVFRAFIAEAYVIPSESMQSNLLVGDRLFANKAVYGLRLPFSTVKLTEGRMPHHGEVVLFVHPKTGQTLIKRVVAVGGDTIEVKANRVLINGKPLARQSIAPCRTTVVEDGKERTLRCHAYWETAYQDGAHDQVRYRILQLDGSMPSDVGPQTVPSEHVFVMGDNRDYSSDSRYWGTVPRSHLMGRAMFIYYSSGKGGIRWSRFFDRIE